MMRKSWLLLLLLPTLLLTGCADENPEADSGVHPDGWFLTHRSTRDINECGSCHGVDLRGSGDVPSCFSADFDGRGCHPDGPGQAPHPLDGSYLDGANHGPEAKADLTGCQICHSDKPLGGPGSNPRFNVGIDSVGGTGCEACHGTEYAHPAAWAGPNPTFHYTAGNIQQACTLCHGPELAGGVGVSCLGCHAEATTFTLDCGFCHEYPPDGATPDLDVPNPVAHGNVVPFHDECVTCHGLKEAESGGGFSAVPDYALFNAATDVNGDHWDGNINMNSDTGYNEVDFGCDAARCHGNDAGHQLADSGLPVELGTYGIGSSSFLHPLDGTFLNPANHGPAAKAQAANFPDGLIDCQPCHAEAGTDNPRFNVGIAGNGCELCHNDFTAHPSQGARENVAWFDVGVTHSDIDPAAMEVMCVLCHDTTAGGPPSGGVGPACSTCHPADPLTNASGCVSCHNLPPDGSAPAGAVRPNREGRHGEGRHSVACETCHSGVGFGTATHFDQAGPADVVIQDSFGEPAGSGSYDPVTGDCSNITCHGGAGSTEGPWY